MNKFNIAILTLLGILIAFQGVNYFGDKADKSDRSRIDTIYVKSNDRWHTLPGVNTPVPYRVEVPGTPGATITIPAIIDTMALIADYFTRRTYSDSLKNDSISIHLTEKCYKNQIYDRHLSYQWTAPTMVIRKTETSERQLLFVGADVTGNKEHFGFYPSAYFDTRRAMFGGGYDIINHYYKVGAYGKIKLWKKKHI